MDAVGREADLDRGPADLHGAHRPKDDGGLLGAGELAWDAVQGRAAARRRLRQAPPSRCWSSRPRTSASARSPTATCGSPAARHEDRRHRSARRPQRRASAARPSLGVEAVQRGLDFQLAAPRELAGLPRKQVRLVRLGDANGALSVYGEGLGGIVVIQHPAPAGEAAAGGDEPGSRRSTSTAPRAPSSRPRSARWSRFERGGVSYTVVGSVPPAAVENAARGLR